MQLNDEQKQKVAAWIADGVKLSDIQSRLGDEFDVRMTYMDVRLLVDDLKLTPKDPVVEPEKKPDAVAEPSPIAPPDAPPVAGKVSLTVDSIARPGAMVSGGATFSDGKRVAWYVDTAGRLGVVPEEQGYRPPEQDVQEFQTMLDRELQKLGY